MMNYGRGSLLYLLVALIAGCTAQAPFPTAVPLAAVPSPRPSPFTTPVPAATTQPVLSQSATHTPQAEPSPEVEGPTPEPTPLPTPFVYLVEVGDTPAQIASQFGVDLATLLQVNQLADTDLIFVGQELVIPPAVPQSESALPIYYVQPGDTFSNIAATFGIEVISLQQANGDVAPEALPIGQPLKIPVASGEVHWTVPGDTLGAISLRYDVSLDDLLLANADILNLGDPDYLPAGVLLAIPQASVAAGYDCSPRAPRTGVIEHVVANGEQLFCLGRKFGLDLTTLLYANPPIMNADALQDGISIIVPPEDGAVYEITAEDVANGTRIQDILAWYGISRFDDVRDWEGDQAREPLQAGDRLFVRQAELLAGTFTSQPAQPIVPTQAPPAPTTTGGEAPRATSDTTAAIPPPPAGDEPPGALLPRSNPWAGELTAYDAGSCGGVADGSGWSGALAWPLDNATIKEGRAFRPGHTGLDIEAPTGTPLKAAETGQVVWAGFSRWGGGNTVVLGHGNSRQTIYYHLDKVTVGCDQQVGKGEVIGTVGQTGAASFPHVHLEVRFGGFSYDPLTWLP